MTAGTLMPAGGGLTPEEVVRDLKQLPASPRVLPRLKELLGDGNSSIHEIVALIRLEPGMAARVLQVANSAYFCPGAECGTVEAAVIRVGFNQIYELVSYAVAAQVLVRPLEIYGLEAEELWEMSVAGALAAESIAVRTGQDPEIAYTVGLLHCVGMVALDEWALRRAHPFRFPWSALPREATEREFAVLGFTQADTGGALLRHWGFPATIAEPVRRQYAPRATAEHLRMATLLLGAKWLRDAARGRCSPCPEQGQLAPLGVTPADLKGMVAKLSQQLTALTPLLKKCGPELPTQRRVPAGTWTA